MKKNKGIPRITLKNTVRNTKGEVIFTKLFIKRRNAKGK